MNMNQCTSHAPWAAKFRAGWTIISARNEPVASISQSIVHDEVNAYLIAAAPELLSALERLTHPMADDEDLDYAREVIEKAKGGQ